MKTVHMPRGAVVHVLPDPDLPKASCGAPVHYNRAGYPIEVDPDHVYRGTTPAGVPLTWCGKCLGVLAVAQGHGQQLADQVVTR